MQPVGNVCSGVWVIFQGNTEGLLPGPPSKNQSKRRDNNTLCLLNSHPPSELALIVTKKKEIFGFISLVRFISV